MTPEGNLAPRPESPKLLIAAMAIVWSLCLAFSVVCYFLFQIENQGFFGSRRGPMDPVVVVLTVTGMIVGVAAPVATSYAALRSWRQVAVAAVAGAVLCVVVVQLLFRVFLGVS